LAVSGKDAVRDEERNEYEHSPYKDLERPKASVDAQPRAVIALHSEQRDGMSACSAAPQLRLQVTAEHLPREVWTKPHTEEQKVAEADPQHSALADTCAAVKDAAAAAVCQVEAAREAMDVLEDVRAVVAQHPRDDRRECES